jgi:hypothetical protein
MYLVNNSADAYLLCYCRLITNVYFPSSKEQVTYLRIHRPLTVPRHEQHKSWSDSLMDDIHSKVQVIRQFLVGEIFKQKTYERVSCTAVVIVEWQTKQNEHPALTPSAKSRAVRHLCLVLHQPTTNIWPESYHLHVFTLSHRTLTLVIRLQCLWAIVEVTLSLSLFGSFNIAFNSQDYSASTLE